MGQQQAWIDSAKVDIPLIILPGFLSTALVLIFNKYTNNTENLPLWAWLFFVLLIDVAHVYSSLFRTYFDKNEFKNNTVLFTIVPLLCWIIGVFLYSLDYLYFWRLLAYTAVFHFARQQYGFLAIYKRNETNEFKIDECFLYLSMLYPIIFWHTHLPRKFNWFIEGDFFAGLPKIFETIFLILYLIVAVIYYFFEIKQFIQNKVINLPKNLLILSTAITWFVGIVLLNGDLAFTITNVVAHGIPYMALVFLHQRKNQQKKYFSSKQLVNGVVLFFAIIIFFAYLEEGLWDGFIWKEHTQIFSLFQHLPNFAESQTAIWLIPLLSIPQFTHYILDAFIWKIKTNKKGSSTWNQKLFTQS